MASADESFLTVADVAQLLQLSQQTIRTWIGAGKLPALHIGRLVRIRRSELERFIEGSYTSARSPSLAGSADKDARKGELARITQ